MRMKAKIKIDSTAVEIFLNDMEIPQEYIQTIDIHGKAGEYPKLTLGLRPQKIEVEMVNGEFRCIKGDTPFERKEKRHYLSKELIFCDKRPHLYEIS